MLRSLMPRGYRHLQYLTACVLAVGACGLPAAAQQPASTQVKAKLVCGSHSANPKELRPFEVELQFKVSGALWISEHKTNPKPGEEKFLGILSPSNTMLIVGEGKLDDGSTWSYEFSGRKKPNGITILRGSLTSQKPKGTRLCSLAF